MKYPILDVLLTIVLFIGMFLCMEIGRRIGIKRIATDPQRASAGTATIEGAVFALFGLLIAFTFSGAGTRFDVRRNLIVDEANAISTAYLRLDLLKADAQPALRELFRKYLDARLEAYQKLPDEKAAYAALDRSKELQSEIWTHAVAAINAGSLPAAPIILMPALNQMFDIATTRTMVTRIHPPGIVFVLLLVLGFICSMLAGYGMAASQTRSWLHMIGFVVITAVTVFVILDIEYPRRGLIQVKDFDQVLIEVRGTMK